jgi:hypothetical protein
MTDKSASTELAPAGQNNAVAVRSDYGLDVGRAVAMRMAVVEVMKQVMKEGTDFGEIPGTTQAGKKPKKALLQPGAEVLCQVFRLRPEYIVETRDERPDFILLEVRCRLYNSVTGELVGEASGSANSREQKYLVQTAARICPACGKATIIKGKEDYGGGWLCFVKKGGCGAKYGDEDKKILDQTGAISADKVMDLHHTIISIAQKRAYVRAVRNATACSDIFTDEDIQHDDDITGDSAEEIAAKIRHQRTQLKPTTGPKILATDVLALTGALREAQLLPADLEKMPPAERDPATRKLWLDWANGMLEDAGKPKVGSMMEIPQDMVAELLKAAKEKRLPKGW